MALSIGSKLLAHLKYLLCSLASSLRNGARILDRRREGRFTINVLAGLQASEGDLPMLVRGGGDKNRLHFLLLEHFPKIFVFLGLGRGFLGSPQSAGINIADGDYLSFRM